MFLFTDEEEDYLTHFTQRGKGYNYTKDFELYDDDFNFIKQFDSKFKMMAHFHPKNKF